MTREEMNAALAAVQSGDRLMIPVRRDEIPCAHVYLGTCSFSSDSVAIMESEVIEAHQHYFTIRQSSGRAWSFDRPLNENMWNKVRKNLQLYIQFESELLVVDDFEEE